MSPAPAIERCCSERDFNTHLFIGISNEELFHWYRRHPFAEASRSRNFDAASRPSLRNDDDGELPSVCNVPSFVMTERREICLKHSQNFFAASRVITGPR